MTNKTNIEKVDRSKIRLDTLENGLESSNIKRMEALFSELPPEWIENFAGKLNKDFDNLLAKKWFDFKTALTSKVENPVWVV